MPGIFGNYDSIMPSMPFAAYTCSAWTTTVSARAHASYPFADRSSFISCQLGQARRVAASHYHLVAQVRVGTATWRRAVPYVDKLVLVDGPRRVRQSRHGAWRTQNSLHPLRFVGRWGSTFAEYPHGYNLALPSGLARD
jgi:hypothetical protein